MALSDFKLTDKIHTFFLESERWGKFEVMFKSGLATVDHVPPGATEDAPAFVWKLDGRKGTPGANHALKYVQLYLLQIKGVKPEELAL